MLPVSRSYISCVTLKVSWNVKKKQHNVILLQAYFSQWAWVDICTSKMLFLSCGRMAQELAFINIHSTGILRSIIIWHDEQLKLRMSKLICLCLSLAPQCTGRGSWKRLRNMEHVQECLMIHSGFFFFFYISSLH